MIVVDTSVILAFMNSADTWHEEVCAWMDSEDGPLATTPLILAEADHLVGARGGSAAQEALRLDLASGAYAVEWWRGALNTTLEIAHHYKDGMIGLADASLIALAGHIDTLAIATLDERHFRAARSLHGDAFRLLPADH
ncbi:MAG: PIN domain-containing protein [Solirubrobacterales bacterium]